MPRREPAPRTRWQASTTRSASASRASAQRMPTSSPTRSHTALGGEARDGDVEDELKRAWRRLVALLAGERPLVIGIDDAHWADDGLLDLVEEVVFRQDDVPLMVLCTSRPELLERRPDFGRSARNVTQIELRPLNRGGRRPAGGRSAARREPRARGARGPGIRGQPVLRRGGSPGDRRGAPRRGRSPPRHRAGGDRSAARPTAAAGEAHAPARLGPRAELPRGGTRRPDARARRPPPWPISRRRPSYRSASRSAQGGSASATT